MQISQIFILLHIFYSFLGDTLTCFKYKPKPCLGPFSQTLFLYFIGIVAHRWMRRRDSDPGIHVKNYVNNWLNELIRNTQNTGTFMCRNIIFRGGHFLKVAHTTYLFRCISNIYNKDALPSNECSSISSPMSLYTIICDEKLGSDVWKTTTP